jgi:hypothetical protein
MHSLIPNALRATRLYGTEPVDATHAAEMPDRHCVHVRVHVSTTAWPCTMFLNDDERARAAVTLQHALFDLALTTPLEYFESTHWI